MTSTFYFFKVECFYKLFSSIHFFMFSERKHLSTQMYHDDGLLDE